MVMKSLSGLRSLVREPQMMHRWQISVPQWPAIGAPANRDILFLATTSDLPPAPDFETAKVQLGGFTLNYHGKETRNNELTITFYENTDQEVTEYFFETYANARQNSRSISDVTLASATTAELIAPAVTLQLLIVTGKLLL